MFNTNMVAIKRRSSLFGVMAAAQRFRIGQTLYVLYLRFPAYIFKQKYPTLFLIFTTVGTSFKS